MRIGVPKEIKRHEYRVGVTPGCVKDYIGHGHSVAVEAGAGLGAGFTDDDYRQAGAEVLADVKKLYDQAQMIVKVKEPQSSEYELFHEEQILYTYLHLAADKGLAEFLAAKKVSGLAYETIQEDDGSLPCLLPMSEIAGRLSVQVGVRFLEKPAGGRGVLLGGVPGVERGKVLILGGGVVGANACKMAVGLGAQVTILETNTRRLAYLDDIFSSAVTTLFSNRANLEKCLPQSDLVIGAVLIPGGRAPHIITREDLKLMKPGAVIVDVSVDQGGCAETTKATTHDQPVYVVDGVIHYTVANMPGAVPITATAALVNHTLKYGLLVADEGIERAAKDSRAIGKGMNTYKGYCVHSSVAQAVGMKYEALEHLLN